MAERSEAVSEEEASALRKVFFLPPEGVVPADPAATLPSASHEETGSPQPTTPRRENGSGSTEKDLPSLLNEADTHTTEPRVSGELPEADEFATPLVIMPTDCWPVVPAYTPQYLVTLASTASTCVDVPVGETLCLEGPEVAAANWFNQSDPFWRGTEGLDEDALALPPPTTVITFMNGMPTVVNVSTVPTCILTYETSRSNPSCSACVCAQCVPGCCS